MRLLLFPLPLLFFHLLPVFSQLPPKLCPLPLPLFPRRLLLGRLLLLLRWLFLPRLLCLPLLLLSPRRPSFLQHLLQLPPLQSQGHQEPPGLQPQPVRRLQPLHDLQLFLHVLVPVLAGRRWVFVAWHLGEQFAGESDNDLLEWEGTVVWSVLRIYVVGEDGDFGVGFYVDVGVSVGYIGLLATDGRVASVALLAILLKLLVSFSSACVEVCSVETHQVAVAIEGPVPSWATLLAPSVLSYSLSSASFMSSMFSPFPPYSAASNDDTDLSVGHLCQIVTMWPSWR